MPDPRDKRGQRHAWSHVLVTIVAGLASGYQTAHAIAHWTHLHMADFQTIFPKMRRMPSESTILRALRQLDVDALEAQLAQFTQALDARGAITLGSPPRAALQGHALDGKAVRGANAHGARTHLVSLVQHGSGLTLAQTAVAQKRNELTASHTLLDGRDLTGMVITMDALLAQRSLAAQIRAQGGHYLMVIKQNHAQMCDEVAMFFDLPSIPADEDDFDQHQTTTKAHGRIETRTLERCRGVCPVWNWPDATQVLRRTCERLVVKSGTASREVTYGITSLSPSEAHAMDLEVLWRNHWTIENRKHYVRDVTMGEDRNHMHTGHAPHVLAAFRNALIDLWRAHGWTSIAAAIRVCAASLPHTLALIGAIPYATLT